MAHKDPMIQAILKADHLSEETRLGFRSSAVTCSSVTPLKSGWNLIQRLCSNSPASWPRHFPLSLPYRLPLHRPCLVFRDPVASSWTTHRSQRVRGCPIRKLINQPWTIDCKVIEVRPFLHWIELMQWAVHLSMSFTVRVAKSYVVALPRRSENERLWLCKLLEGQDRASRHSAEAEVHWAWCIGSDCLR